MRVRLIGLLASAMLACFAPVCFASPGSREHKPAAKSALMPERIEVSPSEITLEGKRATRQFVVTGYFNGEPHDVTAQAEFRSADRHVVNLAGSQVRAEGNGRTFVMVRSGSRSVRVPVVVSRTEKAEPIQFQFETVPILTKQGCATGSCHGSPHGKGGFSLSLYGYDPTIDRISLTHDGFSRRINVMEPADSLMLKKPLLEIPHVGGKRLRKTDAGYRILRDWIYQGARTELTKTQCERIVVTPGSSRVLHAPYLRQQISVLAHFSNGAVRDVTPLAAYDTSNASVATVAPDGQVTGHGRGQAAISVRYLDKLQSVNITVVEDVPGFAWNSPPENNFVDRLVDAKLKQLQYLPSEICSDSTFLRRVSLDLTGLLPAPEKTRQFLADRSPDKRAKLIDALLETDAFSRFWALKKADLMRVSPQRLKGGRAEKFAEWIVDAYRKNMPYDQFAREILTAKGDTEQVPAANYYLAIPTMEERTEMTAQIFMGSRLECSKCHNHPFEKWTQRDYYSIGAVFARTQAAGNSVNLASAGDSHLPTTGETMQPWGASAAQAHDTGDADRRVPFAAWLTAPGNPYFARVEVNRIWADLMGRGIVEPVDDFRSSNPPMNAPLLDALAQEFKKTGYNRKQIIRLICNSRAYQRTSLTNRFNASDDLLFSHARVRLLMAEQLKDAMALTTRVLPPVTANSAETQSAQMANRMQYATQRPYPEEKPFTVTFGQPPRATACTCERQNAPTLLQALELLNGGTAYQMAQSGSRNYAKLDDDHLIEELYLSGLCRFPTDKERATAKQYLTKAANRENAVMDLVWTLLNTQEFLFQH